MAPDVFLSYSREDQATARRVAEALQHEGLSVWWDQSLHSGEAYDKVTESALREAKAVVLLWSRTSVESRWVRAEATTADRSGTLLPAMIEPCSRPIMFELTHTADLSGWKGDVRDPAWRSYMVDVHRAVERGATTAPTPNAAATPVAQGKARRTAWSPGAFVVAGALALMIAGLSWALFVRSKSEPAASVAGAVASRAAGDSEAVTLAVLPFADLSEAGNQEYFSDGLTEEILNQLAQIRALTLTGRTSSFSFKGRNEDLRVIADKLGVENLLEGSVRRDGKQLRITAQLIDGKSGAHRWSRTYARELSDVFAVQEEIAKDVAQALSIALDVGAMGRAQGGTNDVDAYDRYLQARELRLRGGVVESRKAAQLLREAVEIDPQFARAWQALAGALNPFNGAAAGLAGSEAASLREEADKARARALTLLPDSRSAHRARAQEMVAAHRWVGAEAELRALRNLAPVATEIAEDASAHAGFLSNTGRVSEAIEELRRALQVEPLSLTLSTELQNALDGAGRFAEAQQEYERSRDLPGNHQRPDWLALLRLLSREDTNPEAIRSQVMRVNEGGNLSLPIVAELARISGDRAAARALARRAFEDPDDQGLVRMAVIAALADALGDRELALLALRKTSLEHGLTVLTWLLPHSGVRADPGFKEILRELGLVDYFRASGIWGDFCRPAGDDDFECK